MSSPYPHTIVFLLALTVAERLDKKPRMCDALPVWTIDEIRQRNKEVGQHFFDDSTMKFFGSKIHHQTFGDRFVTSEVDVDTGLRRYTVRRIDWDSGVIHNISLFLEFDSLEEAVGKAQELGAQ